MYRDSFCHSKHSYKDSAHCDSSGRTCSGVWRKVFFEVRSLLIAFLFSLFL